MTGVALDVPQAFWSDGEPEVIHLRRVAPGHLEVIEPGEADRFLAGTGALPAPAGWLELAELHLAVEAADGDFVLRPRLCLRRVPVDPNGRADLPSVLADSDLPAEERRAKYGWQVNEAEKEILSDAIARLAREHEYLDCAAASALLAGVLGPPR